MNEVESPDAKSRSLPAIWKWLGVLLASLIASAFIQFSVHGALPTFPAAIGGVIGGALPSFAIAMLFAIFIRGGVGLVVGVLIVAIMAYFQWHGFQLAVRPSM